jgi:hypothetical protein
MSQRERVRTAPTLADLASKPRWVAWCEDIRTNKDGSEYKTKIPINPHTGGRAEVPTNPATWGTREQAERRWRRMRRSDDDKGGVGVVLGELDDGELLMGIDLDSCFKQNGDMLSWAAEVMKRCDTYAEVSPSGNGIKLFFLVAAGDIGSVKRLLGTNPAGEFKTRKTFGAGKHREIALDRARFYAVTDDRFNGSPKTLRTVPVDDIRWLIEEAGPNFLAYYNKSKPVDGSSRSRDERDQTRSGAGCRFMIARRAKGDSYQQACAALQADTGEAGEWALEKGDERQLQRAWDNAGEFLKQQHSNEQEESRPLVARRIDEFERRDLEWLWYPFVPNGMLTLMIGEKGMCKSSVGLDMAARISTGRAWPQFGDEPAERAPEGSAIILCQENDIPIIIRPRLEAAGADISRVRTLGYDVAEDDQQFDPLSRLDTTIKEVERQVKEIGDVKLIMIDPITDYVGKIDMYRDNQVRALLNPLGRLASKYDLAVLLILHVNKKTDLPTRYRGLGSVAFRNVAQSCLVVAKHPDLPDQRCLAQDAANLTARLHSVSFCPVSVGTYHRIEWDQDWQDVDVDELLADQRTSKKGQAETLLRQWLAQGPVRTEKLQELAQQHHISWRTVCAAKKVIGVISQKPKGKLHWTWRLPA